ncbi:Nitrate regulatory gene2 protein [Bienertia sinuspersici]
MILLLLLLSYSYSNSKSEIRVLVFVLKQKGCDNLMGCGTSKAEDLPLVTFCKERKDLIKSASDHRFALAAAHIAYFRQLKDVGDSLCRFVEEELILSATSSSSPSSPSSLSSPVLTLPSDEPKKKNFGKMKKNKKKINFKGNHTNRKKKNGSSSTSISHNLREVEDEKNAHLHWSSNEEEDDDDMGSSSHRHSTSGHLDIEDEDEDEDVEYHKNEKLKKGGNFPSPQPGISYIPDSQFATNSNYPFPFDSYANPYFPPPTSINSYNNGVPPYYYANPNINSYFPDNGYSNYNSGSNYNYNGSNVYGSTYTTYYMKKSSTRIPSVIYEEPKQTPVYTFSDYPGQSNYPSNPNFGFAMNPDNRGSNVQQQQQQQQLPRRPPTPPSPKVSAWDYFNPFETLEGGGYPVFMGQNSYGLGSNTSSPDSREVREREGIPELEEETESEVSKEPYYYDKKKVSGEFSFPKTKSKTVQFDDGIGRNMKSNANFDEGSSKGVRPRVPMQHPHREEVPHPKPPVEVEREVETVEVRDVTERSSISSPETEIESSMSSVEDLSVKKKGVSFDMDGSGHGGGVTSRDVGSSKPSGSTTLSAHGTRDLKEVVREIKDEFEAATDYGNEVSVLLEVGKEPYKSRSTFLKVFLLGSAYITVIFIFSIFPFGGDLLEMVKIFRLSEPCINLGEAICLGEETIQGSEGMDEEKLRVMYEKQCKKLKTLDDNGAVTSKIEATQLSNKKATDQD